MENIFCIEKVLKKHKKENERGIISTEGLTAFLFWSLLHFQPRCDYSQIVLSGNKSQMHQQFSSSSSLFSSHFFLDGKKRWFVPDTAVLAHPSGI